jgi:ERCC4-related helicase
MDTQISTSVAKCPNTTTGDNSEAVLANGLTAEPEEFEITIDYSTKLGDGKQVRKYQHELAEPGIKGENCIVVAPTGSGKTLVAALVISDHLQKNQHNDDKPNVLFIVSTRPLADQQREKIKCFIPNARVECSMGDGGPSVAELLPETDVIVCTAGKLLDSVKGGKVTFDQISLIVMDECHHTKKESSQANIMRRYLEHKAEGASKFPQVIGLTASPGAGENPDLDEKKTIDHLVNLCAHMDATRGIVTVTKHQEELDRCTNKPSFTLEVLQRRNPQEPFIQMIVHEMENLEKHVPILKCAHLKWSQEYETVVQQVKAPLELSTNPKFRDQISTLCLLRCYSQALSIYMDLRSDDAICVLQAYDGLPSGDTQATIHERNQKKVLQQMVVSLRRLPQIENPLLNAAEEKLASVFEYNQDSKGIFFVRTKVHAQSICNWIESLPIASQYSIHPCVLTGHTRDTGMGMTQVAQQEVMDSFHSGECNLLVATSVAEEGLDVPACNLVIRFQHVSNEIARVQTQGRARADESEGFIILSCDTKKKMQEMRNEMRLRLMESCMQWFPSGEHLVRMIVERQNDIVSCHKRKIALRKQLKSKGESSDFQLKCKKCKILACSGSDIFVVELNSNHHMVTNEEFRTKKIVIRPHDQPRPISAEIAKTHKIFCAKCDADWGIMITWPTKGYQFPVLKCKSFIFEAKGFPQPVRKWLDAPFKVSVWMDLQDQDEESSGDDQ